MALHLNKLLSKKLLQNVGVGLVSVPAASKHWNPKFKMLRRLKVIPVKLHNFHEKHEDLSEEEIRTRLKSQGLMPVRPWVERQIYIGSTGATFEPYVPPEGDGKVSPVSAQGAKQTMELLTKKTKTMMAFRKIRTFEADFDVPTFLKEVDSIYKKAHECMANQDKEELIKYVTERCYPDVLHNIERKTLRWSFIKDIELPRVVHARATHLIAKENMFAQVTVRFHTKQSLAVYDRFGRLMHGSEIIAKDVLEYVVFEKHISNEYGKWRVHEKIIPDWMPPRDPAPRTLVKPDEAVPASQEEGASSVVSENSKEAVAVA